VPLKIVTMIIKEEEEVDPITDLEGMVDKGEDRTKAVIIAVIVIGKLHQVPQAVGYIHVAYIKYLLKMKWGRSK